MSADIAMICRNSRSICLGSHGSAATFIRIRIVPYDIRVIYCTLHTVGPIHTVRSYSDARFRLYRFLTLPWDFVSSFLENFNSENTFGRKKRRCVARRSFDQRRVLYWHDTAIARNRHQNCLWLQHWFGIGGSASTYRQPHLRTVVSKERHGLCLEIEWQLVCSVWWWAPLRPEILFRILAIPRRLWALQTWDSILRRFAGRSHSRFPIAISDCWLRLWWNRSQHRCSNHGWTKGMRQLSRRWYCL